MLPGGDGMSTSGKLSTGEERLRVGFAARSDSEEERIEDADSARLVTRFQGGDQEAFAALYSRYFDRVYGYMRVAFKDRHEAEDAAQQVFLKVFEKLPSYERRGRPFRAWLFTVTRNHAVSELRRLRRVEPTEAEQLDNRRERVIDEDAALHVLDWISDSDLLLFLDRLPLAHRQVLALRFLFGLNTKEIAETLGRTLSDVSVTQSRALRFLRERLGALGRGPAADNGDTASLVRTTRKAHVLRRRRYVLFK
jgi:RNA polymerase sigma-70 factor (ECF subfamily)